MGGISSTRWNGTRTRGTVEQSYTISTKKKRRNEPLPVGVPGLWTWPGYGVHVRYEVRHVAEEYTIRLRYSWRERAFDQVVPLISTCPNYGGLRWWFLCPSCRRRVRDLHLYSYSWGPFLCRHCHDLSYEMAQITRSGVAYGLFCNMARAAGVTRGAARRLVREQIGARVHRAKLIGEGLLSVGNRT